jgi:hypothetical protein
VIHRAAAAALIQGKEKENIQNLRKNNPGVVQLVNDKKDPGAEVVIEKGKTSRIF